MRFRVISLTLALFVFMASAAMAQFKEADKGGSRLGQTLTQRWRAGVIVTAAGGPCFGIEATVPMPINWPEQTVTMVEEDITSSARVSYRMVQGTVKQMVVSIPTLRPGQEARAVVTVEVERSSQEPPEDTSIYKLPNERKLPREVKYNYIGTSPLIESRHAKIRKLAKEIGVDEDTAWGRVEAIYDWVRENVEYKNGPIKGALAALRDGTGDCEELTSLFIAICRAGGIPARTVWVPGHCYPEFYLVDEEERGHWFPCQAAGSRAFGGIPEHRPILQKGDNFRPPHNPRDRQRYMAPHLTGKGGKPTVKWVKELVD
jgi:transglutaminase superfamily protein